MTSPATEAPMIKGNREQLLKLVDAFPDFTIKYVDAFPGVP